MNNIGLDIKNDLMLFDNVKSVEAEKLSKVYNNYIFFSDEGEIWKNGLRYTSKIKDVSTTCNKIQSYDGHEYRLELKGNTLHLTLYSRYYWYIGNINPFENDVTPQRDLIENSSKYMGWRFFEAEENLKFNPNTEFNDINYINIVPKANYTQLGYNKKNSADLLLDGLYRPFDNTQEFIDLGNNNEFVYIAIPQVIKDIYEIGCYDIFMNNYFNTDNLYSIITTDYKNGYYLYKIRYTSRYFLLNIIRSSEPTQELATDICNKYGKFESIDNKPNGLLYKIYYNNVVKITDNSNETTTTTSMPYAYNNVLQSNIYYSDYFLNSSCTYLYYNTNDINKSKFNLTIGAIKNNEPDSQYVLHSDIYESNNVIINDLYTYKTNDYTYFGILSYYNLSNNNNIKYNLSIDYINGGLANVSNFNIKINNILNKDGGSILYTYNSIDAEKSILARNSDIIEISKPTVFFITTRNLEQQCSLELTDETENMFGSKYCLVKGLWNPDNNRPDIDMKFCIMFPHYNNYINYPFELTNKANTTIGTNIRFIPLEGNDVIYPSRLIRVTEDTEDLGNYKDYFDLINHMLETEDYHAPLTIQIDNFEYPLNKFDATGFNPDYVWNSNLDNMIDNIYTIYWCYYDDKVIMDSNNIIIEGNIIKKYNYDIDYSVCREVYRKTYGEIRTFKGIMPYGPIPKVELNINLKLTEDLKKYITKSQYLLLCKKINGVETCEKIIQITQADIPTVSPDPEETTTTSSTTGYPSNTTNYPTSPL